MTLTLATARTIADATLAAGRERGYKPLTVAVCDAGGHLVVLEREDGSGIIRPQIATGKATSALGMGLDTRDIAGIAEQIPHFVAAVGALEGVALIPVPGGVLIRDDDGTVIGAVGVSGDTSDKDEECIRAALAAAGIAGDRPPRADG